MRESERLCTNTYCSRRGILSIVHRSALTHSLWPNASWRETERIAEEEEETGGRVID